MKASANRTQDNESRAVANNVSCKREEREAVRFVDNSSHTKSIAQLQAIADRSVNPHDVQMRKLFAIINNSPQRKTPVLPGVTQKKGPLDEEELQFKSKEAVQKKGPLDEEELQFKKDGTVQCKGPLDEEELQFKAEEPVQKQENKTGLPDDLKAGVENLSGMAMDDVRVHYNSGKPAQLNAYAYTQGQAIYVAPGQEKHLPHETWHVVQQKQGRVQPTMQMAGGVAVNDDKGLEKEADGMGRKAYDFVDNTITDVTNVNVKNSSSETNRGLAHNSILSPNPTVQRVIVAMSQDQMKQVQTLAKSTGGLFSKKEPYEIYGGMQLKDDGDDTITLWGHAGQNGYGGDGVNYSPAELVASLIQKGLDKSGHKKIEILGCAPNQSSDGTASYTQKVQAILDEFTNDKRLNRKITVFSYPPPDTYDDSTDYRFDLIGKFLYVYGPSDSLSAYGEFISKRWVFGNDIEQCEKTNYENALQALERDEFKALKYKTDFYKNVRNHLKKVGLPKNFKGDQKESGNQLLIEGHF